VQRDRQVRRDEEGWGGEEAHAYAFPCSANALITPPSLCRNDKNTFRVEFDLGDSGMSYLPGDALGIFAINR
jgi:sulfite reductase alpha subunit-like flavoprotein